jgi:hypothetical protein
MSMLIFRTLSALLLCLVTSAAAQAETQVLIDQGRIKLGNVLPGMPERLSNLDLGTAPPPGGSRLLTQAEIEAELSAFGENPKRFKVPDVVRVVRKARRFSPEELRDWLKPAILEALPRGVRLTQIKASRSLITSANASLGKVVLPRLPRLVGSTTITAMVEVVDDGEVLLRVPASLVVDISAQAASAAVPRGERVTLYIEKGPAHVSAVAIALQDLEIGDTGSFRIASTQRVLRARLESKATARLVDQ